MILSAYETIDYNNIQIANIINCNATYFDRVKTNYEPTLVTVEYGVRADELAYRLYNNSNLQWIFALLNPQIKDGGFNDWLMTEKDLYIFTNNKYNGDVDGIHHHLDEDGRIWYNMANSLDDPKKWFNADDDGEETLYTGIMIPSTNLDYERAINEGKFRKINVIKQNDIDGFINDILAQINKASRD